MSHSFMCFGCGKQIVLDTYTYGMVAACPHCSEVVTVPMPRYLALPPEPERIRSSFSCPRCGANIELEAPLVGQLAACTTCMKIVRAPTSGTYREPVAAQTATEAAAAAASGPHRRAPRRNAAAVTGFVLGLICIFFYYMGIVPVLAIVFSAVGLAKVKDAGSGRAFAWIGLILGAVYLVVAIAILSAGR